MKVNPESWYGAKPRIGRYAVGLLLLPIAATGCAGPTCDDPSASGTIALKLDEVRSDVLCRGGTVRVSVAVVGNHFYTMLGDFGGSLLGNNKAVGRMFGPPISQDVAFEFGGIDQLVGKVEASFFAQSSGTVTVEVRNASEGFVQGGQGLVTLLGDLTIIDTRFRIVDSGVEDHGERPEDATRLPSDNSVTAGTLRRGEELDYFRLSVEAGRTYRVVFEATSDLRFGTARVDRFGQSTLFVPTDGGTEFTARARRGIVESREFTARATEDMLLGVANPSADPVALLSLFESNNTSDRFPIEYAITVSALGPGNVGIQCRNTEPAPPIDWAQIENSAEGVFDVTCLDNTREDIFLKYVQRDRDVIVETMSTGSRFMILHNASGAIQEVFLPGTKSENPSDLLTNVDANPVFDDELKASFHAGALARARQARSEIERLLDPEIRTRVTGYSLGGAVAVVFSLYLELDGFEVETALTFGQFPVTDDAGVLLFADRPLLRIKSGRDGAPDLYTKTYDHFGDMIILLDGPLFVYLDRNDENFASATSTLRAFDPFVDHTTYLDRLRGKLSTPAQISFCDAEKFLADGVDNLCP